MLTSHSHAVLIVHKHARTAATAATAATATVPLLRVQRLADYGSILLSLNSE